MDFTNMFIERSYLKNIKQQIETDDVLDIMEDLKILIVSDNASGRALGLLAYISEKTKVRHVELASNYFEAKKYVENLKGIDILIYVGNQAESDNYRIIDLVKGYKNNVLINMYAYLDQFTYQECKKHNIFFASDCEEPIRQFLITLQRSYLVSQNFIAAIVPPKKHKLRKAISKLVG